MTGDPNHASPPTDLKSDHPGADHLGATDRAGAAGPHVVHRARKAPHLTMAIPASGTILRVGGNTEEDPRPDLENRGHVVIECRGPNGSPCPIVDGAGCRLVDLSMGIVFQLDLDDPYNREILRCYRTQLDRTVPIHVTATPDQAARFADDLAGTSVITDVAEPHLDDLSDRVTTADLARRALAEFVSGPSGTRPSRTTHGHFTVDWAS